MFQKLRLTSSAQHSKRTDRGGKRNRGEEKGGQGRAREARGGKGRGGASCTTRRASSHPTTVSDVPYRTLPTGTLNPFLPLYFFCVSLTAPRQCKFFQPAAPRRVSKSNATCLFLRVYLFLGAVSFVMCLLLSFFMCLLKSIFFLRLPFLCLSFLCLPFFLFSFFSVYIFSVSLFPVYEYLFYVSLFSCLSFLCLSFFLSPFFLPTDTFFLSTFFLFFPFFLLTFFLSLFSGCCIRGLLVAFDKLYLASLSYTSFCTNLFLQLYIRSVFCIFTYFVPIVPSLGVCACVSLCGCARASLSLCVLVCLSVVFRR